LNTHVFFFLKIYIIQGYDKLFIRIYQHTLFKCFMYYYIAQNWLKSYLFSFITIRYWIITDYSLFSQK